MSKAIKTTEAVSQPSSSPVTAKEILAAALLIGTGFVRVTIPTNDLIAEAEEMLLARGDAADMAKRGYPVADWMYEQIAVLVLLLRTSFTSRALIGDEQKATADAASAARDRMFVIRERLGSICEAVGFESEVISAPVPHGVDDVGEYMAAFCGVIRVNVTRLPDRAVVEAMLDEIDELVAAEKKARAEGARLTLKREATTLTVNQLKRMLFDQLRHVSRQGLSAYPNDVTRQVSYRLERFAKPTSPTKKTDAPAVPAKPDDPEPS